MRSKVMWGTIILFSSTTLAACNASQSLDAAAKEPEQLELTPQEPAPQPAPVKAVQPKKAVAKDVKAAAAPKTMAANTPATSVDVAPVVTDAPVMESRAVAVTQAAEESVATTIAGCLIHDEDDNLFQLKDTDGMHAPKARSWKSGFIKKGSAKVDILDTNNRLSLASHVGYRVSVSGTLADREMQARSVRTTTERCD
jgi:hypothetical protein